MGADVYLRSEYEPHHAVWKPQFEAAVKARDAIPASDPRHAEAQQAVLVVYDKLFERGYFRDSYNPTGVASILSFSWWRDIVPMLDDENKLPIPKAREFLAMVLAKRITPEAVAERMMVDEWGETPEQVLAYFQKKREALCAILQRSIDLNEPLECSL